MDEAATGRTQRPMEDILEAMKATNALFMEEVIARGNVDALERIYTADARVLPPGAEMVSGLPAIQQFWADAIKEHGLRRVVLEIVEAMPAGDGVVEIGRADIEAEGGGVTMKTVIYWRQEGGRWKWHVDIWNPSS
jgi:ketosteroid isomerase-like protein